MKLIVENLTKKYEKKEVLKELNYTFEEGKIYGLIGRNGAGKTTFFNALNEDVDITSGNFFLEENNEKKKLTHNEIGYVTATPIVPEFLTAKEFIQFYLDINENKKKKTLSEYFDLIKINEKEQNILLKEYSHGMKNKIQILVNIIANPKIFLLDEPLTSLDIVAQEDMKKLLKSIQKNHIIIVSTHILELALDLCDEILIITDKKIEKIENKNITKELYRERIEKELKELNNA